MSPQKARSPAWTRDELILALDLYFRAPGAVGHKTHPEAIALSQTLNALPIHPLGDERLATFRNPSGVGLKLANFRFIDPDKDGGMKSASKLDRAIFEEFASDLPLLRKTATAIRDLAADVPRPQQADTPDIDAHTGESEGSIIERVHRSRERNAKLVKKKKQAVVDATGRLVCEVCDFDFEVTYGPLGAAFAECHHKRPVSEMHKGEKTHLNDLAIVCSNCHRMIHRYRPWKSLEELKTLIAHHGSPA